jgi:isocitrate dehydrogenase
VVRHPPEKVLVGVDVFVDYTGPVADLAEAMQAAILGSYGLQMITNRGVKVWPNGMPETFCTDHWRCRYLAEPGKQFNRTMVIDLLRRLAAIGVDFIKTEHLYRFDGEAGFSLGQGQ